MVSQRREPLARRAHVTELMSHVCDCQLPHLQNEDTSAVFHYTVRKPCGNLCSDNERRRRKSSAKQNPENEQSLKDTIKATLANIITLTCTHVEMVQQDSLATSVQRKMNGSL